MDDEGGLGILPTKEELATKAQAKPQAAPAVEAAPAPKKKRTTKAQRLAEAEAAEPEPRTGSVILVLKTQVGQERRVAEALGGKARRFKLPVLSLLAPAELRGYVFIETTDPVRLEKGVRGISYARALIKDPTSNQPRETPFSEIAHFLTPVSAVAKIAEGDIVELVSGPFRGEKAKVTRVDDTKEEITVELIESMVPIPITVKGEHVRVLQKSGG
jgi:transcription termination/antitermination protein NusG